MDYPSGWPGIPSLTGDPNMDAMLTASNAQVPASAAPVAPVAKVKKKALPLNPMVVAPPPKKIDRTSVTEDNKDIDTSSDSETDTTTNRQGQKASTSQKDEDIKTNNQTEGVKAGTFNPVVSGDTMDFLRNTPEYKDNQASMGDLKTLLDMEAKLPAGKASDPWVQPLLMLADAQTGSQMAKNYKEPPNPNDRMKLLLKYQDDLAKRKADAFKTLVQASPHLINGSIFDRLMSGDRSIVGNAATQANSQTQTTGQSNTTADKQTTEQGTKSMQGSGFQHGNGGLDLTPFEKSMDVTSAKDFATWASSGGAEKLQKNIGYLQEAKQQLMAAKKQTGMGMSGALQGLISKSKMAQSMISPDVATIAQKVNNVAASSLKENFGGRPSTAEFNALQKLTFDPSLPEDANIATIDAGINALTSIQNRQKAMMNYAVQNRTLRGFNPQLAPPTKQQFKAGDRQTKDGISYIRQKDGTWAPTE